MKLAVFSINQILSCICLFFVQVDRMRSPIGSQARTINLIYKLVHRIRGYLLQLDDAARRGPKNHGLPPRIGAAAPVIETAG